MREQVNERIAELEKELEKLRKQPIRTRCHNQGEKIALIEGEIKGLKWALWFHEPVEPNLIEQ